MSRFWYLLLLLGGVWSANRSVTMAQTRVSVEKSASLSTATSQPPDSARTRVGGPTSPSFTASTDQRFFFFDDTRNENGRRMPVIVYGLRAGFLFPCRRGRNATIEQARAAFKAGAGFYFVNQTLNQPGLLPATTEAVTRRLRIVTAFFEPYLFNKGAVKVSLPIELGYGHSRYERSNDRSLKNEVARGFFLPAGIGVQASYQFPALRWFRSFHWFGLNVLTGYRFVLKKDIPASQINYSGCYVSAGPSFYFDSFTTDYKKWRKKRRSK